MGCQDSHAAPTLSALLELVTSPVGFCHAQILTIKIIIKNEHQNFLSNSKITVDKTVFLWYNGHIKENGGNNYEV